MLVTAIVVSWNREVELRRTLEALLDQVGVPFEVVVVDNGSTDQTHRVLDDFQKRIRVIGHEKNIGAATARNRALTDTRSKFVLFLDSDAVLMSSNSLQLMVDHLSRHPSLAGVGLPIFSDREQTRPWVFGLHFTEDLYLDWERTRVDAEDPEALTTCCALVRREAVEIGGGFDPFFFYDIEDVDFFLGLRQLGYRFGILPGEGVWHLYSSNGRKKGKRIRLHFRHEWRHQYLFLKRKGFYEFLKFIRRVWGSAAGVEEYYRYRMNFWEKTLLYGLLPLFMIPLTPLAASRRRKNFLRQPLKAGLISRTSHSRSQPSGTI